MNIVKLTSENIKRLFAVSITPQGNVVVLGGKNGQGKTSVLDSIEIALSGGVPPKMPVRRGEEKGRIVVDLGEIVVRRTFTAEGGTSLIVTNADGVKQTTPQSILDKLTGKLTFDPLDFSRQKPPQQAETLRSLVGLDFSKQDADYDKLFAQRTGVNREAKALEARMNALPKHEGAPATEVAAAEIIAEQQAAVAKNTENAQKRNQARAFRSTTELHSAAAVVIEEEIKRLQLQLRSKRADAEAAANTAAAAEQEAAQLTDIDLEPFRQTLTKLEADNRKVRENKTRAEVVQAFKSKSKEAEDLTKQLEEIQSAKRRATTAAKWPIEGLSFDTAGGVTLNSIPFEQCSSAEQLRVSVAIGLALNPKLRVLLIRDGSLLDDDSLAMVAEMATKASAQVWIERVAVDAATSVVIEDGRVKDAPKETPAPAAEPVKELL